MTMTRAGIQSGGMSTGAWDVTLDILEKIVDIIKGVLVVAGIIAANIADVAMGTIAMGFLFGNAQVATQQISWMNNWVMGGLISVGASSIQIFLWSAIQRRHIGLREIIHFNRLPAEIKPVLIGAGVLWLIDTGMDVSPIALMVQNSTFMQIGWLYKVLVAAAVIMVIILCGFAEILTSNMRAVLQVSGGDAPVIRTNTQPQTQSRSETRNENRPVSDAVRRLQEQSRTANNGGETRRNDRGNNSGQRGQRGDGDYHSIHLGGD